MMDVGPDQKRPRLVGPSGQWQTSPETSRQLPPPPGPSYPQHQSPFSRPPEPQPHMLDRRPSDHAQYEHQDPRRSSSGSAHGYHTGQPQPQPPPPPPPPFRPPQDAMAKRDPSEETPQQQYRSNSTGNLPDHSVNPPHHEASGRPYQLPPFDSAHPRAVPYQPNPYPPPQSPMSATEPYNHPLYGTSGLPPPRDSYTVSYPAAGIRATGGEVKKKAQRAAQACDSCRNLKARCDEGRPACSSCKEKNVECRYRDPPPKQQDKASADIMESLIRIESVVSNMSSKMVDISSEMSDMKKVQRHLLSSFPISQIPLKEEVQETIHMPQQPYSMPSVRSDSQILPSNESPFPSTPGQRGQEPIELHPEVVDEEEEEEEGGDPPPAREPSIPVNHTTGAARLLLVPPIAEMCKEVIKEAKIKNEKYPLVQERKRGILRVYGRGEGLENTPGYEKDPAGVDYLSEGTPGDNNSEAGSPAAGEEWGQSGGLTPPANLPIEITRGEINHIGVPDFSRETVLELVKSYKKNINNMHPILIPSTLDQIVDIFLRSIPESQARPRQISTLVAGHSHAPPVGFVGYKNPESPGNKRKRSPASGDHPDIPPFFDYKPGHPYRSISSALVLLVLALGKICQVKGKIPDVYKEGQDRDSDSSFASSPTVRNGHPPSPLQSSPSMSTMGLASPQELDRGQPRSRRTSIEGSSFLGRSHASKPRNLDVIPGLAYFAMATDIIGNQLGGNSLQHVHVNLLAGLYHGQLGRIIESHTYIHEASRALQYILNARRDKFKRIKDENQFVPAKDNPVLFAFWTCLQLESDILAELPCPHSGILAYEEDMPSPNLQAASDQHGFDPLTIESYTAQLFLRKHLNQLHNMFYRPENESQIASHFPTIEATQQNLTSIKAYAPHMQWDVNAGEPALDILGARLRAKYYGAQVITYRHFVLKILEYYPTQSSHPPVETASNDFINEINVPILNKNITRAEDIDPKILEYAENGIRALIFSTTAFHGLGDPGKVRLIVTNVWGTAHAQWGNMLTLQAAYMNPILKDILLRIITRDELVVILEKTIAFLELIATRTSALSIDVKILKHTSKVTGLLPSEGPNTTSSFSSATTGDVTMGGH